MRVLLATDRCFLPPTDGSSRVYEAWLQALTALGADVAVVSFDHRRARWTAAGVAEMADRGGALTVAPFVGSTLEAAARRGSERLYQLVSGRRHLPDILARPWSAASRRMLVAALRAAPAWDAVIVQKLDTAGMIGTAALRAAGGRLVLDLHDNLPMRQSLTRAAVRLAIRERNWPLLRALRPEEAADALLPHRVDRALADEARRLDAFDDVLFASEAERASYEAAGLDPARCRSWNWGFDAPDGADATTRRDVAAFDVGFIGGANPFNLEALGFLARDVLPRLERRLGRKPTALLAGGSAAAMRPLFASRPEILVEPWVGSLASFYERVAVVVVPLLSGTGVSIKTIEAARFGAALVSTSVGARGVALSPGHDFELADDADRFAAAIAALVGDPGRRAAVGGRARTTAETRHSLASFTRQVGALLETASPGRRRAA